MSLSPAHCEVEVVESSPSPEAARRQVLAAQSYPVLPSPARAASRSRSPRPCGAAAGAALAESLLVGPEPPAPCSPTEVPSDGGTPAAQDAVALPLGSVYASGTAETLAPTEVDPSSDFDDGRGWPQAPEGDAAGGAAAAQPPEGTAAHQT